MGPALVAVMVIGLVGCTGGTSPSASSSTSSGVDLSVLQPNSRTPGSAPVGDTGSEAYSTNDITQGKIRAAVDKVDAIGQAVMKRSAIPGMAIAVVHGGKVVFAKGYGVRDVAKPDRVDADTVFQIASVSKSLSSTCVAKAVTDKIVSWDDPVTKDMPTFALSDPLVTKTATIGDLFAHRTGLPGAVGDNLEAFGFDRTQILAKLNLFPLSPFRISYNYTNFGMTTGGEAVAEAAKQPWDQLCRKELFDPLGMKTASYSHATFLTRPNRAALHFPVDGAYQTLFTRDADAQAPAGGVSASVKDLAAWMTMMLASGKVGDQQVIDPDVLQQSVTPHILNRGANTPDARGQFYGYGINIGTTSTGQVSWTHSGAFYVGAGTAYAMLPTADVGSMVLTNAAPVGVAETVTTTFTDLVRTGTPERDWLDFYGSIFKGLFVNHSIVAKPAPTPPVAARPLSAYVGTFTNAYVGDVVVSESGGALTVTLGPKGLSAPLKHYDGDTFSWVPPGGGGNDPSAVVFGGGGGGAAATMSVEALMLGDLTRR